MLVVEHVSKVFHAGTPNECMALADVSLSLMPGEFVVVIGSNGAGKSTLLNVIAGGAFPDRGKIAIDSTDVTRLPGYQRSRLIGRVFQDWTLGSAPDLTVAENLAIAQKRAQRRTLAQGLTATTRRRSIDLLATIGVGLEDRLDAHAGLLSAGQRQALAMVMAVASAPRLLLLDEHSAALDPISSETILRLTERLILKSGLTTLMVTYNMRDAIRFGSRLVMMRHGRIHCDIDSREKSNLTIGAVINRLSDIDQVA